MEYLQEVSTEKKEEKESYPIWLQIIIGIVIIAGLLILAWILGIVCILGSQLFFEILVATIDFIWKFMDNNRDFLWNFGIWVLFPMFVGVLIISGVWTWLEKSYLVSERG